MTLFAQDETKSPIGTIVLVAKCPLPGTVKTRLAKDFGFEKAASIAQAMLCDILQQVGFCVSSLQCLLMKHSSVARLPG